MFSLTRESRVAAIAQADVITTEPVGSRFTFNGYTDAGVSHLYRMTTRIPQ
ncbi:MAG: hypothetical protein PUP91_38790 [Rhizonema sp. PD37]|nr:hypothetical protein [Rhizonema sp. PD37]